MSDELSTPVSTTCNIKERWLPVQLRLDQTKQQMQELQGRDRWEAGLSELHAVACGYLEETFPSDFREGYFRIKLTAEWSGESANKDGFIAGFNTVRCLSFHLHFSRQNIPDRI